MLRISQALSVGASSCFEAGRKWSFQADGVGAGWEAGWAARASPEMKGVSANRVWQSGSLEGSWLRRCLFPWDKESRDAERRVAFDSAKGTPMQRGVDAVGRDGSTRSQNSNLETRNLYCCTSRPFRVSRLSNPDWSETRGKEHMPFHFNRSLRDPQHLSSSQTVSGTWKRALLTVQTATSLQLRNGSLSSSAGKTGF